MIRKIGLVLSLVAGWAASAQQGTYSPYSFYGLGENRFKGTAEFRQTGGLSFFADSIHVNTMNPAGIANLKLTTYTAGGSARFGAMSTETGDEKAQRTTLDYFVVGVPVSKSSAFSFGLLPINSVGYCSRKMNEVFEDVGTRREFYDGEGDVNRVYLAYGQKLGKYFSLGAEVNYNFGEIETSSVVGYSALQYGVQELNTNSITGFGYNLGAQFEMPFKNKYRIMAGVSYQPEFNLKSANTRVFNTVSIYGEGLYSVVDQRNMLMEDTDLTIANKLKLGAGLSRLNQWMVGAEVTLTDSESQSNRFSGPSNATFEQGVRYNVGGYFIPKYNSYSSYFDRITYRAGFAYEKTGLVMSGKSITDATGYLGFGLPIGANVSNINIGFEYGKKGTISHGLVQDNYFGINIGASLNDRWFVKRKYD